MLLPELFSCAEGPSAPVTEAEEREIKAALEGRSFRRFDPSTDGSPRKGVIIDFLNGPNPWAQYAGGERALDEWEVAASDYRIDRKDNGAVLGIGLTSPRSERTMATPCRDCVEPAGFSLSVRDVFDADRISFRVDDPESSLPSPFPVCGSWTGFEEDIYYD